jgi:hypothetical protein
MNHVFFSSNKIEQKGFQRLFFYLKRFPTRYQDLRSFKIRKAAPKLETCTLLERSKKTETLAITG